MNFCPRCGNKITKEQRFCSKCGNDLRVFEYDSIESQYEVAERKSSIWPFILVGLVVIGIIVSCCFACYHFFLKEGEQSKQTTTTTAHVKKDKETTDDAKVSNDPIKAEKQKAKQSEDEIDKDATHSQAPKIDVMSEDFHKSFMQKDTRDSYMGIKPGMTRAEVEKRYGKGTLMPHIEGFHEDFVKYGNIAVVYSFHTQYNTVSMIAVAPDNISEQAFITRYNSYEDHNLAGQYIYDSVKNNGFQIIATAVNGKVVLIECAPGE
ncbi:zinc-ribbon domain-containing protein [Staphylococcus haemolyticus]|uniref:zinc-ribbon domain-containing protein n=1 Tax=Staphylococcus haemolyticus TaxID=1283 RepID=UPI001F0AA517|nr:zinc ribbon domain-containing protein [Staphylococcus haemolyticus]MCH4533030.1 zinc-ribbon domain-containing protein [Staphylococcus haemolyticus]